MSEKETSFEEDFASKFKEVGIAEFFRRNLHMLGYSGPIKSFTTVVHEFVTNSLDACEEYGILPEIKVEIHQKDKDHYVIAVEDNGPGIPPQFIPKVFGTMLAGTKFHRYVQSRGQQGIGAVGAVLFSQITTGKPVKVISSTGKEASVTFLKIDVDKNKADILEIMRIDPVFRGTRIVAEYKGVTYRKGEQGVEEYLRRTAIANPHARIVLIEPDGNEIVWERSTDRVPPLPKEMKPHPYGLTADDLLRMAKVTKARKIESFLASELARITPKKAKEICKLARVDGSKKPSLLTYQEAERLVEAFHKVKLLAPSAEGLIPIGEEYIERSLKEILKPDFVKARTRRPSVYRGGIPFQVEVAIAYGGGAGRKTEEGKKAEIMRFANKAPLLFDAGGCAITKAVKSINWKNYGISDFDSAPITVVVNVISPHIPYVSAGKQAIADEPEVFKEIRFAIMDVARDLKRYLSEVYRRQIKAKKKSIFLRYAIEVADALAILTNKPKDAIYELLKQVISKKVGIEEEKEEKKEGEKNDRSEAVEGEA